MTPRAETGPGLTKPLAAALSSVGWGTYWFGGLAPRRSNCHLRALIERGLVVAQGPVVLCDGDGFSVTRRDGSEVIREGYALTDAGVEACDDWREKIKKEGRGPR